MLPDLQLVLDFLRRGQIEALTCAHVWIDPADSPITRAPYSPVIGPGRHEMTPGATYVCRRCGATLSP